MAEPNFSSPVTRTYLPRGASALRLDDESGLTKMIVRAAVGTDAKAHLAVPYGSSRSSDEVLIVGSRPDEWFLLGSAPAVEQKLDSLPRGGHVSFVDWTHGRATFRLTGDQAAAALEKLCSLDLSDDMTPNGAAASATVAGVACDLVRTDRDGSRSYLVLCDRSFGQYLFDALLDAAEEFGVGSGSIV